MIHCNHQLFIAEEFISGIVDNRIFFICSNQHKQQSMNNYLLQTTITGWSCQFNPADREPSAGANLQSHKVGARQILHLSNI